MIGRGPILTDGLVGLGPFEEAHCDRRYLAWFKNPTVRRFIKNRPTSLADAQCYVTGKLLDHACRFFSIYLGRKRVGTLKLERGEPATVWYLGLMVGDPSARGHGVGPRAIWLACCYAFDRLKAAEVRAGIDPENRASIRAFEKAGFEFEMELFGQKMIAWKRR